MDTRPQASLRRRLAGAAFAAALAALGGCALPPESPPKPTPEANRLGVDRLLHDHAVAFRPGRAQPKAGEVEALLAFLGRIGARPQDDVFVVADGGEAELAERRRAAVGAVLARRGFQPMRPPAARRGTAGGGGRGGEVRVQVVRYRLDMPACPDWSRPTMGDFTNMTTSNYGCATAVNLGLMLAEPRDLHRGRHPGAADGERAARAIERYRAGNEGEAPADDGPDAVFEFNALPGATP